MTNKQLDYISDCLENTIIHLEAILEGMKDLNKVLEEELENE